MQFEDIIKREKMLYYELIWDGTASSIQISRLSIYLNCSFVGLFNNPSFRWGKTHKSLLGCSRGGNFHDSNVFPYQWLKGVEITWERSFAIKKSRKRASLL